MIIWAFSYAKKWRFLLFSKAFSWDTDLLITLGDLTVKTQNLKWESAFNWKLIDKKRNAVCGRLSQLYESYVQKIFRFYL